MNSEPVPVDPWNALQRFTAARIGRGRTGGSTLTRELLAFNADHALARDAVHAAFEIEALAATLASLGLEIVSLHSAAPDRATYLRRPDLGRKLGEESAKILTARASAPIDLVIIVADGLSASASHAQAKPLLTALLPKLHAAHFSLAPLCLVRFGRVGLLNEIGVTLRAQLALILLGERPGLGTADSLGAYFEFDPRAGRTDAERNCISNIRPAGLPPAEAAERIANLLIAARAQRTSGITLKEDRLLG
ncbi:ethanolamine ammonia-lyase subunit EutC [Oleiharenicola lentus]|uniref:ethanolamine ammonia-lyase subunit EutC n=1 Tax=Oleiharenicola lentus TaxID=2508720 RepID=UPI003F6725D9